jgi:hypothetical protein
MRFQTVIKRAYPIGSGFQEQREPISFIGPVMLLELPAWGTTVWQLRMHRGELYRDHARQEERKRDKKT